MWTPRGVAAFSLLKRLLSSDPALCTLDHSRPFTLPVDASTCGVGVVLLHEDGTIKVLCPVSYFSVKLKLHYDGYSTKLKVLSLIMAPKKFEWAYMSILIVFRSLLISFLLFLNWMNNSSLWLLRWAIQIQEYHLDIQHTWGANNVICDVLSRDFLSQAWGTVKGFECPPSLPPWRTWRGCMEYSYPFLMIQRDLVNPHSIKIQHQLNCFSESLEPYHPKWGKVAATEYDSFRSMTARWLVRSEVVASLIPPFFPSVGANPSSSTPIFGEYVGWFRCFGSQKLTVYGLV